MKNEVLHTETLYRVIKRSRPDSLDIHNNPTSALFKQNNGVSVDRDGNRSETDIITQFRSFFGARFKGLAKVGANVCLENNMAVIPAPTDGNDYHAEIFDDFNKTPLNPLYALILADNAKIVIIDEEVNWV